MGIKALFISVYNEPSTVIYSINELNPECLCFYGDEGTRSIINNEILPALRNRPPWMAEIITEDPEDLITCYRAITRKWGELQRNWRLKPGDWTVDYTRGTQSMTAAIILATLDSTSNYRYIGDPKKSDGGERVIISGQEYPVYKASIWDEIAIKERRKAMRLLRQTGYARAAEIFLDITGKISGGQKQLYKTLGEIAKGYGLWDSFQYKGAWEKLKPAHKAMEMATLFGGPSGIKPFLTKIGQNLSFLEKLVMGIPGIKKEHVLDLLANAKRRADIEQKYDDAIIRLHRALEAFAYLKLSSHGIDIRNIKAEYIPREVRSEFIAKYTDDIDNKIRPSVYGLYRMLQLISDPAGIKFFEHWSQLKLLFESCNRSILYYGVEPVKRERYEEMFKLVCRICDVEERTLPTFPEMNF